MPFFFSERTGAAGFSLVEVLVALAIVGLTLAATSTVLSTGLLGHAAASDLDTALALAEEKLDAAGIGEPLRPSIANGIFAGRFRWRLLIAPYEDKTWAGADQPGLGFRLLRIEVTIAWPYGLQERRVALATVRLAPVEP